MASGLSSSSLSKSSLLVCRQHTCILSVYPSGLLCNCLQIHTSRELAPADSHSLMSMCTCIQCHRESRSNSFLNVFSSVIFSILKNTSDYSKSHFRVL